MPARQRRNRSCECTPRSVCKRPRGVTVSTLDPESSDRGSNPREALVLLAVSRVCFSGVAIGWDRQTDRQTNQRRQTDRHRQMTAARVPPHRRTPSLHGGSVPDRRANCSADCNCLVPKTSVSLRRALDNDGARALRLTSASARLMHRPSAAATFLPCVELAVGGLPSPVSEKQRAERLTRTRQYAKTLGSYTAVRHPSASLA